MSSDLRPSKILLVDDSASSRMILSTILSENGYRVITAENGREALQIVAAKRPALILLDINMPEVDGYEACRRLKADPQTRDIPVIFISAYDSVDDRVKGFDLGGVDYITKPFQDRDVLVRVSNHLQLYRMRVNLEEIVQERTADLRAEICERRRAEEALRSAQTYITNIIDSMPSMLICVDAEARVTRWNLATRQYTGISSKAAKGQRIDSLIPRLAEAAGLVGVAIESRREQSNFKNAHRENGEVLYEDVTVYPLITNCIEGAVIRIDDVTRKVRLEELMIQNEKMLSVGGLAAGMAHEINNPLAGIVQHAKVIQNRLLNMEIGANVKKAEKLGIPLTSIIEYVESRGIPDMLEDMTGAAMRLSKIVENTLSFARKSDGVVSSHNPVELVESVIQLAQSDFNTKKNYDFRTIEIVRAYAEDLPHLPCEKTKIQQVFLNILTNGAQAMQPLIQAESGYRPRFILRLSHESEAQMLCIEIQDNGPGMEDKVRRRVFEPFFTTKPAGVGTGIGLSISYFIITENHGGTMRVESQPGGGTTFIIRLPESGKNQGSEADSSSSSPP